MRSWFPIAFTLLLCTSPVTRSHAQEVKADGVAEALDEDARLDRAVNLYSAGQYEACVGEIAGMLDPTSEQRLRLPHVVELARTYLAACHLGSNQPAQADEPLREAILANPQMRVPDSLTFPPPVIDAFLRVRQLLHAEILAKEQEQIRAAQQSALEAERTRRIERARLDTLERLAGTETVIVKNRRWVAAIPFGAGQFQNGSTALGVTLLVSELAALGTLATAWYVESSVTSRVNEPGLRKEQVDAQISTARDVQIVAGYSFLAFAVSGILEAQLSFVPEVRRLRPRRLPEVGQEARVRPALIPTPGGALLGVGAVF